MGQCQKCQCNTYLFIFLHQIGIQFLASFSSSKVNIENYQKMSIFENSNWNTEFFSIFYSQIENRNKKLAHNIMYSISQFRMGKIKRDTY